MRGRRRHAGPRHLDPGAFVRKRTSRDSPRDILRSISPGKGRWIVTRKEVEEIKGHFDQVMAGLGTGLKQDLEEQFGTLQRELRAEFRSEMGGLQDGLRAEFRSEMGGLRDSLRAEIVGVRQDLGAEIVGVRQDLGAESAGVRQDLGAEIAGVRQELGAEIAEVRRELGAENTETRRHVGVVAEDLRPEIRLVADGVALANERINQLDLRVDGLTGEMRRGFAGVRAEIHSLHEADDELRGRIEAEERRGA